MDAYYVLSVFIKGAGGCNRKLYLLENIYM